MPTLPKFKTEAEIPETLKEYYVEHNGEWVPDTPVNSALSQEKEHRRAATTKLDELTRQLTDLQSKFEGIDPEAARKAQEALQNAEVEKLESEKKFQEAAELKYKNSMASLQQQVDGLNTKLQEEAEKRQSADKKYTGLQIDQGLEGELIKMGADPKGIKGLVKLIRDEWTWEETAGQDGNPIGLVQKEGDRIRMGADPTKPLTPKEHLTPLLSGDNADPVISRFFLDSSGGDTTNNGLPSTSGVFISRADAHDNAKFVAAQEQAKKQGVRLDIRD